MQHLLFLHENLSTVVPINMTEYLPSYSMAVNVTATISEQATSHCSQMFEHDETNLALFDIRFESYYSVLTHTQYICIYAPWQ